MGLCDGDKVSEQSGIECECIASLSMACVSESEKESRDKNAHACIALSEILMVRDLFLF